MLCNMGLKVMPIVVRGLGTVPKELERILEKLKIRGRNETLHTTARLRLARILRRLQEIRKDLSSFKLQLKLV